MKHLVVTGNVLLFIGKKALRIYPLDRYVVSRDGDGNAIEIITRESIHRSLLPKEFQKAFPPEKDANSPGEDGPKFGVAAGKSNQEEADVYTWAKLDSGQWKWHQEIDGKLVKDSFSSSPKKISPWCPLRFNVVDGESYGRGRVEEFGGDLRSLEGLMQSLVEGSAAAAKVVFTVSPSATLKAQSLAKATNGAIIQGRPDDVGVISIGKTADLTHRLADAFLLLNPRQSERTTATEIQLTQQELNEQLGGIFGNLTTELLLPYLNRKLYLLSRNKSIPSLPKNLVLPTVVAGLNNVGRGQDKQALMEFVATIAQSIGPEALATYLDTSEYLKRLAAASGIESFGLVKDQETIAAEQQEAQAQATQQSLVNQAGQLAKSPIAENYINDQQQQTDQTPPPESQEP